MGYYSLIVSSLSLNKYCLRICPFKLLLLLNKRTMILLIFRKILFNTNAHTSRVNWNVCNFKKLHVDRNEKFKFILLVIFILLSNNVSFRFVCHDLNSCSDDRKWCNFTRLERLTHSCEILLEKQEKCQIETLIVFSFYNEWERCIKWKKIDTRWRTNSSNCKYRSE